MKLFVSYINPIMLYNCELWATTSTINKSIDAYQRRLLRQILNLKWPKTISNQKLYNITKATPWSITIQHRRLAWLGHLLRLDESTPAKRSLAEVLKEQPRKQGRPPKTWLQTIRNDIVQLKLLPNISKNESTRSLIDKIKIIAQDRETYRVLMKCCISRKGCPKLLL